MTTIELMEELRRRGVEPRVVSGSVEWLGPTEDLPAPLCAEFRAREAEISSFLLALPEEPTGSPPIDRRGASAGPLSFAQERMWFIDQLTPEHALYNVVFAYRVRGPIDRGALEHALAALVARHEALRTTFHAEAGVPRQVVGPPRDVPLEVVPVPPGDTETREREAARIASEIASRRFDLGTGPLLRPSIVSLSARDNILCLTLHHIATDGWSLPIMEREISELYAASTEGRPEPGLPALPVQYLDYALWQREWLQGDALERQLLYWRTRLTGLPELTLPADRPRLREPSFAGRRVFFTLPREATAGLRALCRASRVTPFMALAAGLAAVLHRVSGQDIVTLGLPVGNRTRPEIEGLVGFFVNSLALASDFRDDPSFETTLARVREATLETLIFQELPFEKIVEHLRPARELSRNPVFSVMLSHMHRSASGLRLAGADVRPMALDRTTAKLDLIVETQETGEDITGVTEYSVDLFDHATVERLMSQFGTLLAAAARAPGTPVSRLPLLDERERRRIVAEFNRTESPYPRDESVAELFRAQARLTPDAVAIEHHDRRYTYAELDTRSDAMAARLHDRGVRAGDVVALRLARSPEAIALTLAVSKAGAAYLPIASEEPPARVASIFTQTRPRLAIVESAVGFPPMAAGAEVITVDEFLEPPQRPRPPAGSPGPGAGERAAYIMYTSGSTGTPKGIAVPNRAIARLVIAPGYVTITPHDRIAHLSNPAFDASTFEVWGALLNGARIVVIDREEVLDPAVLVGRLRRHGVTIAFFTTALFNELAIAEPSALAPLRYVLFGGENVAVDRVRRVLSAGPPAHLVHVYGPTESTTFATAFEITGLEEDATTVPIGRPIARTTCYLLDRHGEPVPIGVAGELFIGGDGLATGYVGGDQDLNSRFMRGFLRDAPGARLYRTGDMARWRPDGTIEFLGRLDDQLKLRGFRVEPGEIEAVLREHGQVSEAVVLARQTPKRGTELVAFVAAAGAAPTTADLRAFVRERLPSYMTPTDFISLPKLPLTANGKVDRRALAAMDTPHHAPAELPQTPLEQAVATIFAEHLGVEEVGRDDDFFSLGGHSLLAVRAVAAVSARLQVPFTLRDFFLAPTVRAVAAKVLALRLARLSSGEREKLLDRARREGS